MYFIDYQSLRFLRRLEQALKLRVANRAVLDDNDESEGSEGSPQASSPLLMQSKQKSTNYRFSRQKKVANANVTWDESDRTADIDILSDD